ncbi:MAG: GNAT family N-acetyltransferase [Acidimicrobiales bacterium]
MSESVPPGYPSWWETHVLLSDGAPVELRPVLPSDQALIRDFHGRQSSRSIYFRFFRHRPELSEAELEYFTCIDYVDRMAFVALQGGELVAIARYEQIAEMGKPEVAFFVDDQHHGRGLATLMLEYLAAAARSHGISGFVASVLPENYAMLGVFRRAGFDTSTRFADGVIEVEMDITLTEASTAAAASRQSRARSQSVARMLRPSTVAVVGAGRSPDHIGRQMLNRILAGGFTGQVHAVNAAAAVGPGGGRPDERIGGVPTWRSLQEIDGTVDLVVVAVPAAAVEDVVAGAAKVGATSVLVVSSGFADEGGDGVQRQHALTDLARRNGMRIVGPNAFGMINTDPDVKLEALFVPIDVRAGSTAVVSQSGPLGGAVLDQLADVGVGISSFVAVGNRADVSVNDLLDYLAVDAATRVILLYVENYGNLRTFAKLATAASTRVPVVSVRPAEPNLVDLLEQSGVILTDGVGELAEIARIAANQAPLQGRRVVVVSNAVSVARLTVMACRRHGLEVVVPVGVEGDPRSGLDPTAASAVLVDDVESADADDDQAVPDFERVIVAAAVSEGVDAVVAAIVPTAEIPVAHLGRMLARLDRTIDKPIVALGMVGDRRATSREGVPVFTVPDEAARALGRLADHAEWAGRQADSVMIGGERYPAPDQAPGAERWADIGARDRAALVELMGDQTGAGVSLTSGIADQVAEVLDVPVAPWRVVRGADDLVAAADAVGYPVVLKTEAVDDRRVGEAGGAAIDLHDETQLTAAAHRMADAVGDGFYPAVIQGMTDHTGVARMRLVQDPNLGVFIQLGVGARFGASRPWSLRRFLPLTVDDLERTVERLAAEVPLEAGDRSALVAMLCRLAELGVAVPELALVELDPILLSGPGTVVGDLRVLLRPWRSHPLTEVRKL